MFLTRRRPSIRQCCGKKDQANDKPNKKKSRREGVHRESIGRGHASKASRHDRVADRQKLNGADHDQACDRQLHKACIETQPAFLSAVSCPQHDDCSSGERQKPTAQISTAPYPIVDRIGTAAIRSMIALPASMFGSAGGSYDRRRLFCFSFRGISWCFSG